MIGIFGGTFDPVHYGHIEPVLSVKKTLQLTQLRFIPNKIPPHRATPWLSVEQRLSLLDSALTGYSDVLIDQRELDRDGPSYMVDTLHSLKRDFPEQTLCLIIGMDAFYGITNWHQWQKLFDLCHLIVTTRPGFEPSLLLEKFGDNDAQFLATRMTEKIDDLRTEEAGKILVQSVPQLDISSTEIRENLKQNQDISQWMPADTYQKLRGFINDD